MQIMYVNMHNVALGKYSCVQFLQEIFRLIRNKDHNFHYHVMQSMPFGADFALIKMTFSIVP